MNPQMSGNKNKDTRPEKEVGRILWSMDYRYRKNYSRLPGKPDFAFPSRKKAIFVNGCWWHIHPGCSEVRSAKSNRRFWDSKLEENANRDDRNRVKLAEAGWDVLTVWACEVNDEPALRTKLKRFLDTERLSSIELFTGAGGLALAVSRAGFGHSALIEIDQKACEMLRVNKWREVPLIEDWPVYEMDVKEFDYGPYEGKIDLLGAGSPCQPFSLGGKHKANEDERNMFPEVIRAIRELKPRAVVVENVKGLKRAAFSEYYNYIILQMTHPEFAVHEGETWREHSRRLKKYDKNGARDGLYYRPYDDVLNAANYGVPQRRDRVFIVLFRNDISETWSYPPETHKKDMLLYKQWVTGEYWEKHEIPSGERPEAPNRWKKTVSRLKADPPDFTIRPWVTVRDALKDLPVPSMDGAGNGDLNHYLNPGARSYPGHTGSILDLPSKTIKAGVHGVPGGENTIVENGEIRYLTIREAARIQTFPDEILFPGAWTVGMRQLGNAVPVTLGEVVVRKIRDVLISG